MTSCTKPMEIASESPNTMRTIEVLSHLGNHGRLCYSVFLFVGFLVHFKMFALFLCISIY